MNCKKMIKTKKQFGTSFWNAKVDNDYANQQPSPLNMQVDVKGKVQRPEVEDSITNNTSVGSKKYA